VDLYQTVVLATWINDKVEGDANNGWYLVQTLYRMLLSMALHVIILWAASRVAISASKATHHTIVRALLQAPIDRFFYKQPRGRLVNRLSMGMRVTDNVVPWVFSSMLSFAVSFLSTGGFILMVLPWLIIRCAWPFFSVALLFVYSYRGTAVPLILASKFALSRAHDLQVVCLNSNVSTRANGMFDDFIGRFNQSTTVIRSAYLMQHVCVAWVQPRIFLCLSVLTTIFAMCGLWSHMPIGTLTMVIVLSNNQMGQFEGLSQLLKITAGYTNEKPVLHSVSFSIAPRMKVGIAGTTGCGKSMRDVRKVQSPMKILARINQDKLRDAIDAIAQRVKSILTAKSPKGSWEKAQMLEVLASGPCIAPQTGIALSGLLGRS